MPFYEYECPNCGYDEEVLQKINDKPLTKCPSCGKKGLKKLMSAPVFRLKGSGWYETDFKSDKENKRNLAGAEKEEAKTEAKAEAKAETKADAKPDAPRPSKAEAAKPARRRARAPASRRREARQAQIRAKPARTAKRRRADKAGRELRAATRHRQRSAGQLAAREREAFVATHAESARLAKLSAAHWLNGVPMHWMRDWCTPHPLFVRQRARRRSSKTSTATRYIDFCFGDTGAMFGHSPPAIARALAEAGAAGITSMLPAERVARVGEKLAQIVRPAVLADDADRDRCESRGAALGARDHRPAAHAGVRRLLSRHGRRNAGARLPDMKTRAAPARAPDSSA